MDTPYSLTPYETTQTEGSDGVAGNSRVNSPRANDHNAVVRGVSLLYFENYFNILNI